MANKYENMFSTISHWGNANLKHSEISHIPSECLTHKIVVSPNAGRNAETGSPIHCW